MATSVHKLVIERDGKLWLGTDIIVAALGIIKQKWYNHDMKVGLCKQKSPYDKRQKIYALDDVMRTFKQTSDGKLDWKSRGDLKDTLLVTQARDLVVGCIQTGAPCSFSAREVEELFNKMIGTPTLTPTTETIMAVDTIETLIIGEDVVSLREGLNGIFGTQNHPSPENAETLIDHVKGNCFGFLDEGNQECMTKCAIRGECAIQRNLLLADIGKKLDERDAARRQKEQISKNFESVRKKRDRLRSRDLKSFMGD